MSRGRASGSCASDHSTAAPGGTATGVVSSKGCTSAWSAPPARCSSKPKGDACIERTSAARKISCASPALLVSGAHATGSDGGPAKRTRRRKQAEQACLQQAQVWLTGAIAVQEARPHRLHKRGASQQVSAVGSPAARKTRLQHCRRRGVAPAHDAAGAPHNASRGVARQRGRLTASGALLAAHASAHPTQHAAHLRPRAYTSSSCSAAPASKPANSTRSAGAPSSSAPASSVAPAGTPSRRRTRSCAAAAAMAAAAAPVTRAEGGFLVTHPRGAMQLEGARRRRRRAPGTAFSLSRRP